LLPQLPVGSRFSESIRNAKPTEAWSDARSYQGLARCRCEATDDAVVLECDKGARLANRCHQQLGVEWLEGRHIEDFDVDTACRQCLGGLKRSGHGDAVRRDSNVTA